ncbi:MAG: efflux RND transporter periplasmic adaptor subunit [Planctomycetota bacterium]
MTSSRPNAWLPVLSVCFRFGTAAVLIAIGLAVFQLLRSQKIDPEPIVPGENAAVVRAILAPEREVSRELEGFGTARAMDAAVVSAQVGARVTERPASVEPGNAVEAGDLLVRLEQDDFASRVESGRQRIAGVRAQLAAIEAEAVRVGSQVALAEEEVEIDRRDLERIRNAAAGGSGTQADIDLRLGVVRRSERSLESLRQALDLIAPRREQLEAELANLRASLAIDEQNLSRTEVVAPIAGTLQTVDVEAGEYVRLGDRVARVVSIDRVEVPLQIAVSTASLVSIGDEAVLTGDGDGAGRWTGRVARVAPESDPATRTLTVFVEVEQAGSASPLLPGQFVMGRVRTSGTLTRVLVPRRAVIGDRVLIARQDASDADRIVAMPNDVRVAYFIESDGSLGLDGVGAGEGERQWAVLASGLEAGETVIISNLDELTGGVPVAPFFESGRADEGLEAGGEGEP